MKGLTSKEKVGLIMMLRWVESTNEPEEVKSIGLTQDEQRTALKKLRNTLNN